MGPVPFLTTAVTGTTRYPTPSQFHLYGSKLCPFIMEKYQLIISQPDLCVRE